MNERVSGHILPKIVKKINETLAIGFHAELASTDNPDIATDHIVIKKDGSGDLLKRLVLDFDEKTYREVDLTKTEE